jgi:biotin operon repressor
MSGTRALLPPAEELLQKIDKITLDKIGDQYGTSRQAVHKSLDQYCRKTFGFGIKEYRARARATQ